MNTEPTGPFPPDADGCICPQDFTRPDCPACNPKRFPVCLPCVRKEIVGLDAELPPPDPAFPEAKCTLCGRRTNHGLYLAADGTPAWLPLVEPPERKPLIEVIMVPR